MRKIALAVLMLCMASFVAEEAQACRLLNWVRGTRSRRVVYYRPTTRTTVRVSEPAPTPPVIEDEKPEPPEKVARVDKPKVKEKVVEAPKVEEKVAEAPKVDKPEPPKKIEKPVPTVDITPERDSRFKLLPDDAGLTNSKQ